jgi:histidine ammonia-lyase
MHPPAFRAPRLGLQEPLADALCGAVAGLSTAAPGALLSAEATRAVLFVKAGELIRAKAPPRAALLRFLAALLEAGVLPALPASDADADALAALADAVCGSGVALVSGGGASAPLAQALAAAGLTPPGLTAAERTAMLAGAAPSVATAALAVARVRKLLPAAEAVSALSCEARAWTCSRMQASLAAAHTPLTPARARVLRRRCSPTCSASRPRRRRRAPTSTTWRRRPSCARCWCAPRTRRAATLVGGGAFSHNSSLT